MNPKGGEKKGLTIIGMKKIGTKSVGIDTGKRRCVVCVMNEDGAVMERTGYDNTLEDATKFAQRIKQEYGACKDACETTGNMWIKTFEAFESQNIPIKLANTFKMKIISETSVKTDIVDARKIADLVRINMIPRCYVAPADIRDNRQLLRHRISRVQDRTKVINRVRSLLDKYDIKINGSEIPSKKSLKQLADTNLRGNNDQFMLRQCVRQMQYLNDEIEHTEEKIAQQASKNDYAQILTSMTGIEIFSAMLIASEIGDISRFSTAKQLVSWAGMCPRVYQSGDTTRHGRIKKDSNRRVNWIMIQAANTAVRHDDRMKRFYEQVKQRHGGNHPIAITHVANKMITIIWNMLTTMTLYSTRNNELYKRKLKKISNA